MSLKKNLFYNLLYTASQLLFPLITIPYVSRVLDPESVGRISFVDSLTYFFIAIAEFGILVYGTREVAKIRNDAIALKKLVSELICLHSISSLVTFFLYFPVVYALYDRISDPRLVLFSFAMLLANSLACEWYFLGTEQFRFIALRLIFTRLAALIAVFLFVRDREDYYLYYLIMVVAVIINMLLNFTALVKQVGFRWRQTSPGSHIRYTSVTFLMNVLYGVPFFLDNVVLGLTYSAFAVGIYAFSMKVIRIVGMAITESLMVFFPRIVNYIASNKTAELQELYQKTTRSILLFCIPVCIGLLLIADDAVHVIFGPQFSAVAINLKILSVFPLLKSYSLFQRNEILLPYQEEKLYVKSLLSGAITFIALAVLLCPWYGDVGASISVIAAELVVIVCNAIFIWRMGKMTQRIEWKMIAQTVAASLLFVPVIMLLKMATTNEYIVVSAGIITCTLLYAVLQTLIFKNPLAVEVRRVIQRSL